MDDQQYDWEEDYTLLMEQVRKHGVTHIKGLYNKNMLHRVLGVKCVSGEGFIHDRLRMYGRVQAGDDAAYCNWLLTALLKVRLRYKDPVLPQAAIHRAMVQADSEWLTKGSVKAAIQEVVT